MANRKKCSGCKKEKTFDNFYKNKLVLDGHSNYCIDCTRENSKRYFKRKKEREIQQKNDNLLKITLLSNYDADSNNSDADNLMKILMIEKMLKNILDEVDTIKRNFVKHKETEITNVETVDIV